LLAQALTLLVNLNFQVEHIIVVGHRDCGGIKALVTQIGKEKKT
jgi:carbonic anhydrase